MSGEINRAALDLVGELRAGLYDEATGWLVLSTDEETGDVDATGPFTGAWGREHAQRYAASWSADLSRDPGPREKGWTLRVVALFAPDDKLLALARKEEP